MEFPWISVITVIVIGTIWWFSKHYPDIQDTSTPRAQSEEKALSPPKKSTFSEIVENIAPFVPLIKPNFLETAEFSDLQRQADQVMEQLASDMAFENSAYRAISRRSGAVGDLLGLLALEEAAILETDVSSAIQAVENAAQSDLRFEDSAIRAIYKNDLATFQMIGAWCAAVSGRHPELSAAYLKVSGNIESRIRFEDSAYRADNIALDGIVALLSLVVTSYAGPSEPTRIASTLQSTIQFDNSAPRISSAHAKAGLQLLLVLVRLQDEYQATRIENGIETNTMFDDSTIREHSQYKQGMVEALRFLVKHPPSML